MRYNSFGNTGIKISALGFGSMRLPMSWSEGGVGHVKMDESVALIRRAFELGVNYVDSAWFYCQGESETAVGRALKDGWREKITLSTKLPVGKVEKRDDGRRFLEEQLKRLDTDHIDVYHLHGVGKEAMRDVVDRFHLLDDVLKAKDEGMIRHVSFSFHDKPEEMIPIIDRGCFSSVLCQYNLLDRANEESIAYAKSKGLGVVIMGPVAGGRLKYPSEAFKKAIGNKQIKTPELALRFVLSNPNVDCALSGMETIQMVEENVVAASDETPLSTDEKAAIEKTADDLKQLASLYCTGCAYCLPCPQDVNIPKCFEFMNYHRVYGLTEHARNQYAQFGKPWIAKGKDASHCIECGACLEKCPQKIPIIERLKETHAALG
ncbi:MAG: aldo/keto reductase [Kiritimatiellaceae bacterium]|nr:aldo/keto reductase [Kiritimatiellaceae bacterium]